MEQLFRQTDLEARIPLNMNVLDKGLVPAGDEPAGGAAGLHRSPPRSAGAPLRPIRLEKIAARLEVLEGYLAVFLNLDKVIKIIRTEDEPKPKLMKAFKLTDNQAEAILNMRLRALRKLEEMEIRGEHDRSDQGAEGTEEAARLRQAQIRKADRGDRRRSTPSSASRPQLGKRRTEIAEGRRSRRDRRRWPRRSRSIANRGGARAHHRRLFRKGLAARPQGPSGTIRRDQISRRRPRAASGSMPRPPTSSCCSPPTAASSRWTAPSCPAGAAMARPSAPSSTCRRKPISSPCSRMCRAASCWSPPPAAMASSPTRTMPSP